MENGFIGGISGASVDTPLLFSRIHCYTLTYVYENSSTNGMYVFMQGCTLGFSTIAFDVYLSVLLQKRVLYYLQTLAIRAERGYDYHPHTLCLNY